MGFPLTFAQARGHLARHGSPLLMLSTAEVRANYRTIVRALPGVKMHYAVKANAQFEILKTLHDIGSAFDVCSNGEIELVEKLGVRPGDLIHTHPVKRESDIERALAAGIDTFVIDNPLEAQKLVPYRDRVRVLVRIRVLNPDALINLSYKFGIDHRKAPELIEKTHALGIRVRGISFHVGSQNLNAYKYIEALTMAREIFNLAYLKGIRMETLDIGGGFPTRYLNDVTPLTEFMRTVAAEIERMFPGTEVIAEPGRFMVASAMTLAATVIGKSMRQGTRWYYIDEGLYGAFSGKVYDHCDYPVLSEKSGELHNSVIAGPTCDSTDIAYEHCPLPELEIGDVLMFTEMGAYTNASASNFNSLPITKIVCVD